MGETIDAAEAERKLMGRAVRLVRERSGMTQAEAGMKLGIRPQAWQRYEAGDRNFDQERIDNVCRALDCTEEELRFARARILALDDADAGARPAAGGLADRDAPAYVIPIWGRPQAAAGGPSIFHDPAADERKLDLAPLLNPNVRVTYQAGDLMAPWVSSGAPVFYDTAQWPSPGMGCVVQMASGEILVRLYKNSDGSNLHVEELQPQRRTATLKMADVAGVYAVVFRG